VCLLQHAAEVGIDGFGGVDVVVDLYGVLVHFSSTSGTDHLGLGHLETPLVRNSRTGWEKLTGWSAVSGQKSDVRCQMSDVRYQMSEFRGGPWSVVRGSLYSKSHQQPTDHGPRTTDH
jgi:hypothetical protein